MSTYVIQSTEEQGKFIEAFLSALDISFIKEDDENGDLPPHVLAGIQRGQADIEAGRTISLEEFKKRMLPSI